MSRAPSPSRWKWIPARRRSAAIRGAGPRAAGRCRRTCRGGVVEAPAPPQAVEKSLAGEGLLAHVVVAKYVDHLPLHRLEGIFAREGIDLSRSTLCGWVAAVASALA